ncbi:MAG: hypothetical protein KAW13_03040 [Dehalococcoidia bacterium]|nr:hypothetical protein [Dehalococcoidia bacterium]
MSEQLEKLLISSKELDQELLATVLVDLVKIDKDSGEIRLTTKALNLPKRLQILVYITGRKAAKALDVIREERISPKELASKLGMGGGSLRGQLYNLCKERLLEGVDGKYLVPNYAIEFVKALLDEASRNER